MTPAHICGIVTMVSKSPVHIPVHGFHWGYLRMHPGTVSPFTSTCSGNRTWASPCQILLFISFMNRMSLFPSFVPERSLFTLTHAPSAKGYTFGGVIALIVHLFFTVMRMDVLVAHSADESMR